MKEIEVLIYIKDKNGKAAQQITAGDIPVLTDSPLCKNLFVLNGSGKYQEGEIIYKLLLNALSVYLRATGGDFLKRLADYKYLFFTKYQTDLMNVEK